MDICKGYSTTTPDGTEYDCEYEFSGEVSCDDCIFGKYGFTQDPRVNPNQDEEYEVSVKTAIIKSKNEFGQLVVEGEAVLLNKMDAREGESFYELRFIGSATTNCRWVDNEAIREVN